MLLEKHQFQLTPGIRKEMNVMCNLAEGIEERALEQGREKGRKEGEERIVELINRLHSDKRDNLILEVTTNAEKRDELYMEYGL